MRKYEKGSSRNYLKKIKFNPNIYIYKKNIKLKNRNFIISSYVKKRERRMITKRREDERLDLEVVNPKKPAAMFSSPSPLPSPSWDIPPFPIFFLPNFFSVTQWDSSEAMVTEDTAAQGFLGSPSIQSNYFFLLICFSLSSYLLAETI